MKIKGVNLGNWLVLEKWMNPELFAGTDAEDEDELCRVLPREELKERLKKHRESYITEEDFRWIAAQGINTVRIPVPHFLFGDDDGWCSPYVACEEYLDRAFDWAENTGLKILIDLHTAPESQNGFDNGGICGVCKWAQSPERVQRVLDVLSMLGGKYGNKEALWGIEVLNEPISEELFEITKHRYLPKDSKRAEGSSFVPAAFLKEFYKKAYETLRPHLPEGKYIVFHDGFRFDGWYEYFRDAKFKDVVLDAHWYLGMGLDENTGISDYMHLILEDDRRKIRRMEQVVPVVIGEWCLSNVICSKEGCSAQEKDRVYRLLGDAQLLAWSEGLGYFFWSYKLLSEMEGWDFRKAVENDWLLVR